MLSSQFENLILEYKQDITVKKMGEPLVARFAKDVIRNPQQLAPATKKIVDALGKAEDMTSSKEVATAVFQEYKERKDMVERKGRKFANLIRQKYGMRNLPFIDVNHPPILASHFANLVACISAPVLEILE